MLIMKKLSFILIVFVVSLNSWGQDRWQIESIGLNYSFNFPVRQGCTLEPGLNIYHAYSSQTPSFVMSLQRNNFILRSSIGLSSYKIEADYESIGGTTGAELATLNLMLSPKAGYKLLNWGIDDSFFFNFNPVSQEYHAPNHIAIPIIFSISPLIGFEYHQQMKELKKSYGFKDLNGNEAKEWIQEFGLAATKSQPQKSMAFLWANAGVSLNAIFFNKVGLFYDLTYNMRLIGTYKLKVDHIYYNNIRMSTYTFDSKYISHTIGIQYYF